MNYRIVYEDELYHYGVKGMKWGVRKDPEVSAARRRYKMAKKEANKAFNKAYSFSNRHPVSQYFKSSKNYHKSNELWGDAQDKIREEKNAKSNLKAIKRSHKVAAKNEVRKKVKAYSQAYDQASRAQDRADDKWRSVSKQYKDLGKTPISRIRSVHKAQTGKGSAAAKKYLKDWDSWEIMQDTADSAYARQRQTREAIGRTWVTRTIRTIRYS